MQLPRNVLTKSKLFRACRVILAFVLLGFLLYASSISLTLHSENSPRRLLAKRPSRKTATVAVQTDVRIPRTQSERSSYVTRMDQSGDSETFLSITHGDPVIHILLNAYHRSGSSFTGRMLASQPRPFYFFEPLMKLAAFSHFTSDNQCCSDHDNVCKMLNGSSDELKPLRSYMKSNNITKEEGPTEILHHLILSIYSCHLDGMHHLIEEGVTDSYTGQLWEPYIHCRMKKNTQLTCFSQVIRSCEESTVRITKFVRLDLDNALELLERDHSLKVVHLFRDPRGILCSRLVKTSWYPLYIQAGNYTPVLQHATVLCNRMLKDFEAGQQIKKSFPQRFRFIRYEDLIYNGGILSRRDLFQFLGLRSNTYLHKTKNSNLNDWTTKLDRNIMKIIDNVCSLLYHKLGYIKYGEDTIGTTTSETTFIPRPMFVL